MPIVGPVSGGPHTIGIDVGASKIVAAVVNRDGEVQGRVEHHRTPDSSSDGLVDLLRDLVDKLLVDAPDVVAVGVGIAGLVTWPEGEVEFAANHGHRFLKLRRNLSAACGLPVVVENDANAAAWAEACVGRRHPDEALLFIAVGTGLGSGFVADSALVRGPCGRGAELGHLVVDRTSSERCTCGQVGCLEVLASGRALLRAGERLVRKHPRGALARRLRRTGVTTAALIDAALDGDPDVVALVRGMGHLLGRTVAENVMSLFPVDRVVLGGGLAVLGRHLLDPMQSACEKILSRSRYLNAPRIGSTVCGPDAILIGAALLAHQQVDEQSRDDDRVST